MTDHETFIHIQCSNPDCNNGEVERPCPDCQGRDPRCYKCGGTGNIQIPCEDCKRMQAAGNSAKGVASLTPKARKFTVPKDIPEI